MCFSWPFCRAFLSCLFVVPFWKVASFHTKFCIFLIKSFIQNPVFLYKTLSFYEILSFGTKFRLFISNYVFFLMPKYLYLYKAKSVDCKILSFHRKILPFHYKIPSFNTKLCLFVGKKRFC